ncbi:CWF19-like protein 2 isoform X1 [Chiloscyllium plagiosum]|uniref:CWF19-like protein 2 isoform X1 n=1 Tax=Chiloscyllium plagiosum TaxID=36176 RepID=UPI001CB887D8|nr:CWF19-like protein 2 isoform X1 [Chiloscyllium plagiosum]
MAEYGGRFESAKAIEERREFKRKAREAIVTKTQAKYQREEQQKQLKHIRGEDTWMLPEVNERLEQFSEEHSVKLKKKKEKKMKKSKKEKKKKKLKEKSNELSESSSDSEMEWIEAPPHSDTGSIKKPWKIQEEQLSSTNKADIAQREEWMMLDFMSLKTVSTAAIRAEKLKEKEMEHEKMQAMEQAEMHKRELNPYWKDGGSGLPSEESGSVPVQKAVMIEDGGLSWLKKSYQRMKEQAEKQQCRLEDVIAARYGSMDLFQKKLQEAEKVAALNYQDDRERNRKENWKKSRNWSSDRNETKGCGSERGLSGNKDRYKEDDRDIERERSEESFQDLIICKERDNGRKDIPSRYKNECTSSDREVEMKRTKDKCTDKSGEINRTSEEKYKETQGRNISARGLESYNFHDPEKEKSLNNLKSKFMKPEDEGNFNSKWDVNLLNTSNYMPESHDSFHSGFQKPSKDCHMMSTWYKTYNGNKPPEASTSFKCQSSVSEHEEGPHSMNKSTETKPRQSSLVQTQSSQDHQEPLSRSSAAIPIRSLTTRKELPQPLSEEEMNKLGAKIIKAELMGNVELASKLKEQLEEARKLNNQGQNHPITSTASKRTDDMTADENQEVILVRSDESGRVWPVGASAESNRQKGGKKKRQMIETHHEGERIRYFQDDDNLSLRDLVRQEKMTSAEDQNENFSRLASKFLEKIDRDNYTLDDMFVSKAAREDQSGQDDERQRNKAILEHKRLASRMEKCQFCFDNPELPKHLVIAIGVKVYLCLPNYQSMTEGHCQIVPLQHHTAGTILDEDIWEEVQLFRKALVKMLEDKGLDCVFFETNMHLKKRFHMVYECIPLPKEVGDMAPIYFKKAIMEADEEWAMNKKLVDLSTRDIRRAIPKGLPYFSVDFGLQGGFAHVIENEEKFPTYFGKEIVGGMLDLEPRRWRKKIRESFDDQRKKVLQFSHWWKPYDCTKNKQ